VGNYLLKHVNDTKVTVLQRHARMESIDKTQIY